MDTQRPTAVFAAAFILSATLLVGLVEMFKFIAETDLAVPPIIPYSITTLLYLAWACLLYQVSRGKNWARILYTVVIVLGLLQMAALFPALMKSDELNLLAFAMLAAKSVAIFLLYVPSSNAWFRNDRSGDPVKTTL